MLSDLEIAQKAVMKPITEIASGLGLKDDEVEQYGKYKAKINLSCLDRLSSNPEGKLIVVTAITPTPLGEGKTVSSLALGQGLAKIGKKVVNTSRQPSKGPTFGIKGGACGGGYSQVVPMEDINLHFTGDIHAIECAHNLLNAALDNSLLKGNPLNLDINNITLRRCVDLNDRTLRDIVIGLGGSENGITRQTGYDITVASETMAILALANDLKDLRKRLARMVVGYSKDGKPVTAEDLRAAGAMCALLADALKPNLVQTLEHTPVLVHCGPFANVAHGNNSILADKIALRLADYVVTEAGFAADCGFEKMVNVKARQGGLNVSAGVVVASIRALKMHGGAYEVKPGKKLDPAVVGKENLEALKLGCQNLARHIAIVKKHGVPAVVAINQFTTDTDAEIELVKKLAIEAGAEDAVLSQGWAKGGDGATDLAEAVVKACDKNATMKLLYDANAPIKDKIETIAKEIYGADGVDYTPAAEKRIKLYTELGYGNLPINMAKTHLSISHDPTLKNAPTGFRVPVRDIRASVGAGFLYPLLGEMRTMPGLATHSAFMDVDVDDQGRVTGLF